MDSRDFSLHSGERQTATEYGQIRADHRFRYEWAQKHIPAGAFGLDLFCGNGYGSWLLGRFCHVIGIDGSAEAIELANQKFHGVSTFFCVGRYPFDLPKQSFDYVVSLESIEHVEQGHVFFKQICQSLKIGGHFVFSTPCEDLLPHGATGNHFHYKHYTLKETLDLADSFGVTLSEYCGQNVYEINSDGTQGALLSEDEMSLMPAHPGQFIIVHAIKTSEMRDSGYITRRKRTGLLGRILCR